MDGQDCFTWVFFFVQMVFFVNDSNKVILIPETVKNRITNIDEAAENSQ